MNEAVMDKCSMYHDYRDHGKIVVRPSAISGNGVFASQPIAEGEVIERCPVLITDHPDIQTSALYPYCFVWYNGWAVPLGNAPLYNHSSSPNAEVRGEEKSAELLFVATRDIIEGEEILIDYGLESVRKEYPA
jgi:SET domain-containing protein